jgi:alpha-beta hydrolase superfamily lysophospholipase
MLRIHPQGEVFMQNRAFNLFITILSLFIVSTSWGFNLAKDFQGFVSIKTKELYVDYSAPQPNKETVVLLNGLTYTTVQWDKLTSELKKKGLGVLRYDMDGMGKTLLHYGVKFAPYAYADQVEDLYQLLKTIALPAPYNIVGLSYGGGIASAYSYKYGHTVKNAILMAPYTEALEKQDSTLKLQVAMTRLYFPFNPASDDEIYDYYLRQTCYTTYPIAEPIVLENPLKLEAVFRLTQGIRKFKATEEVKLFPAKTVHLIIAEFDQYIPREVLTQFWDSIPVEARASLTILKGSEHKIPESKPVEASIVIEEIVSGSYQGMIKE